jgi:hypothetical protein
LTSSTSPRRVASPTCRPCTVIRSPTAAFTDDPLVARHPGYVRPLHPRCRSLGQEARAMNLPLPDAARVALGSSRTPTTGSSRACMIGRRRTRAAARVTPPLTWPGRSAGRRAPGSASAHRGR